jgi:hypothetical protein
MMVARWFDRITHAPLSEVTQNTKVISLDSAFWRNVIETTGQPAKFDGESPAAQLR